VTSFGPVFDRLDFYFGYLFVDALLLPLASTIYVAYAGTKHAPWLVALLGALATTLGSIAQYLIVRRIVMIERGLPRWLQEARSRIEGMIDGSRNATFWALFIIYATPLGAGPLRLVAAAGGYSLRLFALAIFLGCLPYYFVLAWFGHSVKVPAWVYAAAIIAVVALGAAQFLARRAHLRHPEP
jgi:uncharacterized membrane protein YdjX (TVP38/TMEM64 family)